MKNQNTKKTIFREAAKLFSELGYENATMRLIAEKSKITKAAIYYYFPNKKAIFEELLKLAIANSYEAMHKISSSDNPPDEKLKQIILYRFNACKNNPEITRFVIDAITGNIRQDITLDITKEFAPQGMMLDKIIAEGRQLGVFRTDFDVESFQHAFIGALNMYVMGFMKFHIGNLNDDLADKLIDLFMKGIGRSNE